MLIVWRMFDKSGTTGHGQYVTTSGIEWGIFIALGVAGLLAYAGSRIRPPTSPSRRCPGERAPAAAPAPTRQPLHGRRRPATAPTPGARRWLHPAIARAAAAERRRRARPRPRRSSRPPADRLSSPTCDEIDGGRRPARHVRRRAPDAPTDGVRAPARPTAAADRCEARTTGFDDPPEAPTVGQPDRRGPDVVRLRRAS